MKRKIIVVVQLCLALASFSTWAQTDKDEAASDNALYELGFHLGSLLPNQVDGVTEIMGLGGVRAGFRFAPLTYAEAGVIMGNGNGVQWKNVHADVRMDIPIEHLVGIAYVGADSVLYTGNNGNSHFVFGGHAGGGVQASLTGDMWVRMDMKFAFSPGTSLYVGFGLVFRIPEK